tara:strand:+ start:965 stop:1951 length:987 start_codon:yes stop_codon:yes gene_type:complete
MQDTDLDRHIHLIYQTVANPSKWHKCLDDIACEIKAKSEIMELDDLNSTSTIVSLRSSFTDDVVEAFAPFGGKNQCSHDLLEGTSSTFVTSQKLLPQKEYLNKLLPHIKRAHKLSEQLLNSKLSQQLNQQIIEHLDYSVLIVDASRRIVSRNSVADRLFLEKGLLQIRHEELRSIKGIKDSEYKAAVASVCQRSSVANAKTSIPFLVKLGNEKEDHLFLVEIDRFQPHVDSDFAQFLNMPQSVLAMISIRELSKRDNSLPKRLQTLYQLSSVEADIVTQLATGCSPKEIAEERCRSLDTIRTQIKHAIAKVGIKSSTELVALVNKLSV